MFNNNSLYEDDNGHLMTGEEVDELFSWEVIDKGIHKSNISV